MTARETIADNIRTLRRLRSLGQAQLAHAAGVSRRTIARLEAAEVIDPGVFQLSAIAAALGVHPDWLARERLVALEIAVPESLQRELVGQRGSTLLYALAALKAGLLGH